MTRKFWRPTSTGQKAPAYEPYNALLLGLAVLALSGAALYNNYPLVYPDTGTYIHSGFGLRVPDDRPIFYGLFIRLSSIWASLWLVVGFQALFTAWLLKLTVRNFIDTTRPALVTAGVSVGLLATTSAPLHIGQILPDLFTPLSLLALGLLLYAPHLHRLERVGVAMLYVFSLSVHNSHLLLHVLLVAIAGVGWWRNRRREGVSTPRIVGAAGLLLLSWGVVPVGHRIYSGEFGYTRGAHVFMVNRLVESGVLDDYLAEVCPNYNWSLCAYQGQIPTDFIWDYANSPLYKTGGMVVTAREYNLLIRDVFSRPRYLLRFSRNALIAGGKQFFSFEYATGDAPPSGEGSPPAGAVQQHFRHEMREYLLARQQRNQLDWHDLMQRQWMLVWGSVVVILVALTRPRTTTRPLLRFVVLVTAGIVLNAWICGTLSTVVSRYQSRVVWLLPLLALLLLWPSLHALINNLQQRFAATDPS